MRRAGGAIIVLSAALSAPAFGADVLGTKDFEDVAGDQGWDYTYANHIPDPGPPRSVTYGPGLDGSRARFVNGNFTNIPDDNWGTYFGMGIGAYIPSAGPLQSLLAGDYKLMADVYMNGSNGGINSTLHFNVQFFEGGTNLIEFGTANFSHTNNTWQHYEFGFDQLRGPEIPGTGDPNNGIPRDRVQWSAVAALIAAGRITAFNVSLAAEGGTDRTNWDLQGAPDVPSSWQYAPRSNVFDEDDTNVLGWDNLQVITLVPEPGAMMLLGLPMLLGMRRRRR